MFRSPPKRYENIVFMNTLTDPTLASIPETKLEELYKLMTACNTDQPDELHRAIKYAQKMAIFHGVPGLIHYVNLQIKIMQRYVAEHERVDQQCLNTLSYLKLAKLIYEKNKPSLKEIDRVMPDEDIADKNYWQVKETILNKICDMKHHNDEADKNALRMFNYEDQSHEIETSTKNK
tara:strand:+ start:4468 stop:4998 length:531 start_codon:yes stop_codon:yes gene_type:complete